MPLLGIRMFIGLKPLRTHYRVNGGASLVGRKVTLPTKAPTHAAALLRQLCQPKLFLSLLGRTMFMKRSNMCHHVSGMEQLLD
jgi:hypothetical protein